MRVFADPSPFRNRFRTGFNLLALVSQSLPTRDFDGFRPLLPARRRESPAQPSRRSFQVPEVVASFPPGYELSNLTPDEVSS